MTALRDAAKKVLDEIDALAAESNGVMGLHRNGDLATWDWLYEEWLGSLAALRAALESPPPSDLRRCPDCGSTYFGRDGAKALDEAMAEGRKEGLLLAATLTAPLGTDSGELRWELAQHFRRIAFAPPPKKGNP